MRFRVQSSEPLSDEQIAAAGGDEEEQTDDVEADGAEGEAEDEGEGEGEAGDSDDEDFGPPPPKKMMPGGSPEEAEAGLGMGACKPFMGAIVAPSGGESRVDPSAPSRGLALQWVYGYRAFDSKSNVVCNTRGELVYPVAGLVVVYNRNAHKQRHFLGHSDDVRCLAQNPVDKDWIVSGQNATVDDRGRSQAPHACVFNSTDFSQSFKLQLPVGARAVRSAAFSPDGRFVATVANDDDHTLSIWDWRAQRMLTSQSADKNAILQVRWNHVQAAPNAYEIVTVGTKHAFSWSYDSTAHALKGKRVKLGGAFPIQTWNSVTFSEKGHACLAGFDGTVLICSGGAALKAVPASATQGAKAAKVFTLDTYKGGIVAGTSAKEVVVFDSKLAVVKRLQFDFKVTAVHVREKDLVVGTQGAQIYYIKGALSDEVEGGPVADRFDALTAGHSDGELWAQVVSADGQRAWTAGEDNQILQWDLAARKLIRRDIITNKKGTAPKVRKAATTSLHPQVQCCRALALSPNGGAHLAAATNDGSLTVFSTDDMSKVAHVNLNVHGQRKVTNQEGNWTQTMEYSPSGSILAVGTHGSVICLLDVEAGYKVVGKINSHHSFLTHMDWSTDSTMLRANDGAYELLFHSVEDARSPRQITSASSVKDVEWATTHCVFSWTAVGIVPESGGEFVNSIDVHPDGSLLVAANDDGKVALYRAPVPSSGAVHYSYIGHSSHVTSARFTPTGTHVLTTGGHDLALMQWTVGEYDAQSAGQTHTVDQ